MVPLATMPTGWVDWEFRRGAEGRWALLHRAQDLNRRTLSLGPGVPRGLSPPASGDCCQPSAGVSPCWRAGAPHSMVADLDLERQEADLDPQSQSRLRGLLLVRPGPSVPRLGRSLPALQIQVPQTAARTEAFPAAWPGARMSGDAV